MQIKSRIGVFETNSSSVHTLSIPKGKCKEKLTVKDGIVYVPCNDYSDSGIVYGLHDKLSYICSYVAYGRWGDWETLDGNGHVLYASSHWGLMNVLEAVQRRYPKVTELIVTRCDNAVFDHQTAPGEADCIVNLYSVDEIEGFLFNDGIKVIRGRD